MGELVSYLKKFVFRIILVLIRKKWSNKPGQKILISVNNYFSKNEWEKALSGIDENEFRKWNIVFCKNKFEIYKHLPDADICFLFSYNSKIRIKDIKPKMLYFPLLGLDFLQEENIPDNFKIEKPPAFSPSIAIAEYCVAMLILLSRNLQFAFYDQRKKKWDQELLIGDSFIPVSKFKIGILGVGNIGKAIAAYFKKMGCFVAGCDKCITGNLNFIDKWFNVYDLKTFLELIDVLIVALPLTSETKNLIGLKELECLGSSSYLINISRGDIIKEKDLFIALINKVIKGAVLDVFSHEPLSSSNKFYNLDNVIITPHIAGNINLFVNDIQKDFILKALKFSANV